MKTIVYYTKEGRYETTNYINIPFDNLHSPNEKTPALIYPNGTKHWFFEGDLHRLSGPAVIFDNGDCFFWLNDKTYNIIDWLDIHPNKDKTFQAFMKLKYS